MAGNAEEVKRFQKGDEIELRITAKLTYSPNGGILHVRFADCIAEIFDDEEEEKKLGEVAGYIGGGIDIFVDSDESSYCWNIPPLEFWRALTKALEERKGEEKNGT